MSRMGLLKYVSFVRAVAACRMTDHVRKEGVYHNEAMHEN